MKIKVDLSELEKLSESLEYAFDPGIPKKSLRIFSLFQHQSLVNNSPVKTGFLRRNWNTEVEDDEAVSTNNTSYLPAVNYGRIYKKSDGTAGKTKGSYFIERTQKKTRDKAIDFLGEVYSKSQEKAGLK